MINWRKNQDGDDSKRERLQSCSKRGIEEWNYTSMPVTFPVFLFIQHGQDLQQPGGLMGGVWEKIQFHGRGQNTGPLVHKQLCFSSNEISYKFFLKKKWYIFHDHIFKLLFYFTYIKSLYYIFFFTNISKNSNSNETEYLYII